MINRLITIVLITVMLLVSLTGCQSDPDLLTPDKVDISMVDQVVKVKGEITFASENPMGVGGMYMKIGNSKGEVDVRIQPDLWDSYEDSEKKDYQKGRTVTVEGVLFQAGIDLVVVHGKYLNSSNTTSTANSSSR